MSEKTQIANAAENSSPIREVSYVYSNRFVPILQHLNCSILVSTYQAGKVAVVGTREESLHLSFSNFQQAMGVAVSDKRIAVGSQQQIWFLNDEHALGRSLNPSNPGCYLARESFVTGPIQVHEMAWTHGGELWIVNTLFSCLCTLHEKYNFVPRWKPKFISQLAAEDRCHLNGLAIENGQPRYVTAMGQTDEERGWREKKANGGVIIDLTNDEVVADGLCMPHSPRVFGNHLWVLDSGAGTLNRIDRNTGEQEVVVDMPGFGRGLAFHGQFAFVGMSKARETSVFGGIPIGEKRDQLKCGILVVDLHTGQNIAYLEFTEGVEEIFDIQVVSHLPSPLVVGPYPIEDQQAPIWVVPPEPMVDKIVNPSACAAVCRS